MKSFTSLRTVLEMIKFEHTVFALPFAFLGMILAADGLPSWRVVGWIVVARVGARSAAMSFNRLVDRRIDAANPRTEERALPAGAVSPGFVSVFILVSLAVYFLAAWRLNDLALKLSPVALAVFMGYSYTKRFTSLSHLALGLALAGAPLGAWIAVRSSIAATPLVLAGAVVLWAAGFDASWEIDIFGRNRRGVEAATATWQASVESYRDVLVSLYAEIAANYILVRTLQARLDYANTNADALEDTAQLTQDRFDAGLTSLLDVTRARSNLASTRAAIPSLESDLNAAMNRLAVLLGMTPGSLHARLQEIRPLPDPPADLLVGLPADLLRRRPDVRRAERELAAQTARIGVATADLYPSFSISGFLGLESTDWNDLTKSGGGTWGLIPGFRWNLFNGGATRGRIRIEEARTEQALVAYEQTVLTALEDVENAMVALDRERIRRDRLQVAVEASRQSVSLVHTQYISGLTDFQSYLDAQRSLVGQLDELAFSEGQVVQDLIALNKALGGGWSPDRIPEELLVAEEDDR